MDPDDYMIGTGQAVEVKHLKKSGVKVTPGRAVTYMITGADGLSKIISIQPIKERSYRLEP